MADNSANNKRLAKNTIMLYFRMIFLMIVTLYTSRVTLQVLGVDDFGTYNIVGGVVVLFSFLSTALNTACNRFFSVAIAFNDEKKIQSTFSTALVVHIFLMLLIALLLETIGLWFVQNKLNLPEGRENIAIIIYHIAVLSVCANVLRTPFNASIIANERMDFYAYTSIVEGVLKLAIVWILLFIPYDRLLSYSILVLITILVINFWYVCYCRFRLKGCRLIFRVERKCLREILTFSGWSLFGGIADIGWQQGSNIILNLFHGVVLNAAMGITNQIRMATYSFVANLQSAANPQIIKAYASGQKDRFYSLINSMSKYSFYLMLFFSIPLILNMDYVLHLWLVNPPQHAVNFAILILIFSTIGSLGGPLWVSVQATGDVKTYSLTTSIILLLNLPVTYTLFYFEYQPESMLVARILIAIFQTIWMFAYSHHKVGLSVKRYVLEVLCPITIISAFTVFFAYFTGKYFESSISRLIITSLVSTIVLIILVYSIGITRSEKEVVLRLIKSRLTKHN